MRSSVPSNTCPPMTMVPTPPPSVVTVSPNQLCTLPEKSQAGLAAVSMRENSAGVKVTSVSNFEEISSPGLSTDCRYATSPPQTATASSVAPPEQEKYTASMSWPS